MGLRNLPLASGDAHCRAFERCGWLPVPNRRGRGSHILMQKPGHPATLSIPDHHEVKRALLQGLLRSAGISEQEYLEAFYDRSGARRGR